MTPGRHFPSVRPRAYLYEHMFPTETTEAPARRSLSEFLRDALGTAIEFATLGEATLDEQSAMKVRYVRAEEAAAAPVPLPYSLFGETRPATAAGAQVAAGEAHADRTPSSGDRTAQSGGRFAAPTDGAEHPHRSALRLSRPSRPRRPGAVPPRPPVCTMPVVPVPAYRPAQSLAQAKPAPVAHRHDSRD